MSSPLPALALTLGDPAGVGPEVILKALANLPPAALETLTLFGSWKILEKTYENLHRQGIPACPPHKLKIREVPLPQEVLNQIQPGQGGAASGQASFAYLEQAILAALEGEFQGIVTAPIAKWAWKLAGHDFPGQTEVLAQYAQREGVAMAFLGHSPYTGWVLRTVLATTHIPFNQVSQTLTPQLLDQKLDLLMACLTQDFQIPNPVIAVAGLNPHSGEGGQLGTEEQDWLIPWLKQAQDRYPQAKLLGPVPPDTLWVAPGQAWFKAIPSQIPDAYLALYHDQGLIPVKLMAFDQAVNVTLGLPFIRTSPDHGTAFDIAGRGLARSESFQAALAWALELAKGRSLGINSES